jgi:hypothetical protein
MIGRVASQLVITVKMHPTRRLQLKVEMNGLFCFNAIDAWQFGEIV